MLLKFNERVNYCGACAKSGPKAQTERRRSAFWLPAGEGIGETTNNFEKFSSFLSSLTMATMEMSHLLVMQWFQSAYQSDVIGALCVHWRQINIHVFYLTSMCVCCKQVTSQIYWRQSIQRGYVIWLSNYAAPSQCVPKNLYIFIKKYKLSFQ